jgi:hypothetical protein
MTDAADRTAFDLRAELARIDRERAETQKLGEETRKYVAEAHKLAEEARKYSAETQKLNREYRWFPWLQLGATALAAVAAVIAAIVAHHG